MGMALALASHADVLRGSSRVTNPLERLRGRLPWPKTVFAINVQYPQPFPRVLSLPPWERGHGILWTKFVVHPSCLPFTWANRSVPFTRKRPRRPETCIKEWNTNFRLQYSSRKNRGFSDVPLLPEIFSWVDRKSRVLFTFQPDFPENCCKW